MINILIIEDEIVGANHLKNTLSQCHPAISVVEVLRSVKKSVKWLQKYPNIADLILMDIRLVDGICFDIFDALPDLRTPIIFTTAYNEFAIEAFKVNSVMYLLKPITKDTLKEALDKYLKFFYQKEVIIDYQKLAMQISLTKNYKTRFLIKQGKQLHIINVQNIAYFYTERDLTLLITFENKKYSLNQSLNTLEKELNPYFFYRLSRNVLAHIEAIQSVQPYFKGRLIIALEPSRLDKVIVSSERTGQFKEWVVKS